MNQFKWLIARPISETGFPLTKERATGIRMTQTSMETRRIRFN